jgi:aspartyl-tRNA(Asn)/glutamyl-tRNA(Gln) amidotransferase subunit B
MASYVSTIGLEIHAELKTRTKMFCNSSNNADEVKPNVNICPVCLGHPGTLPVINKEAVRHVLTVGVALNGNIADYTEFDRKNYFYPDIPKGYQVSQYKYPLVQGGELAGVLITRIHLEEDTARTLHEEGDYSLVDFNRAGVPLMELVTEPVIHDTETAGKFAKELQLLLRTLGVSEANMEKGQMRVEANVSIARDGAIGLGTKVEVKNLNSFRSVERAIAYEVGRQKDILDKGNRILQETRGWDENKQKTFSQRVKEESHDYRYFPEPDLPKLKLSEIEEFNQGIIQQNMPELPNAKRKRFIAKYGVKSEDAEMFVSSPMLSDFFERVMLSFSRSENMLSKDTSDKSIGRLVANYLTSDIVGLIKADTKETFLFSPEQFGALIKMIADGEVSSRGAKDVLAVMYKEGGKPKEIAEAEGLIQKNDKDFLRTVAEGVISNNPNAVYEYKNGKSASLQYLVGQCMKETKGAANPQALQKILVELLG